LHWDLQIYFDGYPTCHVRYGAQDLKRIKKQKMKDIIKAMEAFNENLVGGKRLVKVGSEQKAMYRLQTHGTNVCVCVY